MTNHVCFSVLISILFALNIQAHIKIYIWSVDKKKSPFYGISCVAMHKKDTFFIEHDPRTFRPLDNLILTKQLGLQIDAQTKKIKMKKCKYQSLKIDYDYNHNYRCNDCNRPAISWNWNRII